LTAFAHLGNKPKTYAIQDDKKQLQLLNELNFFLLPTLIIGSLGQSTAYFSNSNKKV